MFKKVLVTAILLGLFVAGSLIANEPLPTYYVEVEIHGTANTLIIGYKDVNNQYYYLRTYYDVPSGTHPYNFYIPYTQYPPETICAEGWGYANGPTHDYDECDAQLYYTNHLELWLNGAYPYPFYPEPLEE
ncbi:MAG: hypothetical protein H8D22_06640 [Candidatus Cloacimonetes bacterium]|nr:hypothetical protein [Candidatus Cloacimonadota bacterium]